jgi:anti-sigma B factor antagonist
MEVEISKINDIAVLKFKNKCLDASNGHILKNQFIEQIAKGEKNFILDLSEVDFIDTLGISIILSIVKLGESKDQVLIAGAKGQVLNVFKMTNLLSLLRFQPTVADAVQNYTNKASSK